jgi:hypothetical protein
MVAGCQPVELAADIEIVALHPDHRSTPRHRRKDRDLVTVADRMVATDIILIDRDPHYREVAQRFRITGIAAAQPVEQSGDVIHLGGLGQIFFRMPDAGAQPSEIEELYLGL